VCRGPCKVISVATSLWAGILRKHGYISGKFKKRLSFPAVQYVRGYWKSSAELVQEDIFLLLMRLVYEVYQIPCLALNLGLDANIPTLHEAHRERFALSYAPYLTL
jgi:hypothetical protein